MTSFLLSLLQELFNYIINYLPRKYISTLLATSKSTYIKSTCAFNKSCFYIILAELLYKGLRNIKKILDNIVCINLIIQVSHIQGYEIRIVLYTYLDNSNCLIY